MLCIVIVNSKGGVGKTTLTAALAVRAAAESKRVAAVDLDPQHSLAEWWHVRAGGDADNPRVFADENDAGEAREKLELDGWDWVLMDGPPSHLNKVREMLAAADFAVIPVKASALDVLATVEAVELARQRGVAHFCVLNECSSDRLAREAREQLTACRVPVASTEIAHRIGHVVSMGSGKTAAELGAKGATAAAEIDALWSEVKAAARKAARSRGQR